MSMSADEREATRLLWNQGWTAGQISAHWRGQYSRNSVIGVLYRAKANGLPVEERVNSATGRLYETGKPRAAPKVVAVRPVPNDPLLIDGHHVTLKTINSRMCHFPIGDPRDADFHYCGNPTDNLDRPYCPGHRVMMYKPQSNSGRGRPRKPFEETEIAPAANPQVGE